MDVDAARRHAGLKPLPQIDEPAEPKQERGHGRGKTVLHNARGQHPELRGVPLVGTGPGAIKDSTPGGEIGSASRLEQAGREIVRAKLNRHRFKRPPEQVE